MRKSLRNVKTGLNMNPCINSEDISEKKIGDLVPEPMYSFSRRWLFYRYIFTSLINRIYIIRS